MGQITEQLKRDPEFRAYVGRARLLGTALANQTDYVEFPVADVVGKSMGVQRGEVLEERFRLPGWSACFTAEEYPLETTAADRKALGDALWELVTEQTWLERWAYEHAAALSDEAIYDDDPRDDIYDDLDETDRELCTAISLVSQGRAALAHLGDSRVGRHAPEWLTPTACSPMEEAHKETL